MTAPIALFGGGEHLDGCDSYDIELLELVGVTAPRVIVLPFAAAKGQRDRTARLAKSYWDRLGVRVAAVVDTGPRSLELLRHAHVAVLPGGHPNKLHRALHGSEFLAELSARWRRGDLALSGSSAGAMCLCDRRFNLYPPNPLRLIPGFGILQGIVAAPHFDRFRARRWAAQASALIGQPSILGLDEGTGIVGKPHALKVKGRGVVTVLGGGEMTRYHRDEVIDLGRLLAPQTGRVKERSRMASLQSTSRHSPVTGTPQRFLLDPVAEHV